MSASPVVFHSSEADAPIAEGWYIGFCVCDECLTTDGAIGPYRSEFSAKESVRFGGYLYAGHNPQA